MNNSTVVFPLPLDIVKPFVEALGSVARDAPEPDGGHETRGQPAVRAHRGRRGRAAKRGRSAGKDARPSGRCGSGNERRRVARQVWTPIPEGRRT